MSTRLSNVIFAASLATFVCVSARAQTATPTPAPQQTTNTSETAVEDVDLAITARVTARELRFEKVPNTKVEFPGKPRRETVWQTERENLPDEVRPGVTYRDIGIRLRITSVFADIDRIVAEALGEKPLTDDSPPAPQPRNDPQPQPPSQPPAAAAAPRASPDSPAPAPATNRTTRQRRGTTRGGRHR